MCNKPIKLKLAESYPAKKCVVSEIAANSVSNGLPTSIDRFLQDFAQTYGGIDYSDITTYGKIWSQLSRPEQQNVRQSVKNIRTACNELAMDIWEAADEDEEVAQWCEELVLIIQTALENL